MLLLMLVTGNYVSNPSDYLSLDSGWTIIRNDESFTVNSLKNGSFKVVDKGDVVVLQRYLPTYDITYPELEIFSVHSVVDVFLDGENIYSYGHDLKDAGKVLGYGYHYIELPKGDQERLLRIEFHVTENNAFSSVPVPRICNAKVVNRDFLRQNSLVLSLSCFMTMFGVIVGVAAIFGFVYKKNYSKLLFVALFSLSIGCWIFANYNLLFIYTDRLDAKVYLEFGGLQLATLSILLYFRDDTLHKSKKRQIIYRVLEIALSLYIFISFIGQAIGVLHFPATLPVLHLFIVLVVCFIISTTIADMVKNHTRHIVLLGGIIFVISSIISDMLRYYLTKYVPTFANSNFRAFGCIGATIFVLSMVLHSTNQMNEALQRHADEIALQKMAFTDPLTELPNRRACENLMDIIDLEKKPYAILEFDLNNLKHVNDVLGHEQGDDYIKSFGFALKEAYFTSSLVSRVGGDEFVVIFEDSKKLRLTLCDEKLNELIDELNKTHEGWQMSTAYGCCLYNEKENLTIRDALKIADERMYDFKSKMKAKS